MKTTMYFFFASVLFSFSAFGQQWTSGTDLIYTTSNVVSIGGTSVQGQYGNPPTGSSLEIVSPQGSGSLINFKTGSESAFLSFNSIYQSGFYLPGTRTFGFFVNSISTPSLYFQTNGSVSIGTTQSTGDFKLAVAGKIIAEELKVQLQTAWPDYVFSSDYKLPSLKEVEKQIQEKGHLENIPSACEVQENGIEVGEMNRLLLEKVEELTLYTIDQQKQLDKQTKEIEELKALMNTLIQKNK